MYDVSFISKDRRCQLAKNFGYSLAEFDAQMTQSGHVTRKPGAPVVLHHMNMPIISVKGERQKSVSTMPTVAAAPAVVREKWADFTNMELHRLALTDRARFDQLLTAHKESR